MWGEHVRSEQGFSAFSPSFPALEGQVMIELELHNFRVL